MKLGLGNEKPLDGCRKDNFLLPKYGYFVVDPETNTYDPFYKRISGVNERFFIYEGTTYSSLMVVWVSTLISELF